MGTLQGVESQCAPHALQVWSWPEGEAPQGVTRLAGHSGRVEALALRGDGARALSTGRDSSVMVWQLGPGGGSARQLARCVAGLCGDAIHGVLC